MRCDRLPPTRTHGSLCGYRRRRHTSSLYTSPCLIVVFVALKFIVSEQLIQIYILQALSQLVNGERAVMIHVDLVEHPPDLPQLVCLGLETAKD